MKFIKLFLFILFLVFIGIVGVITGYSIKVGPSKVMYLVEESDIDIFNIDGDLVNDEEFNTCFYYQTLNEDDKRIYKKIDEAAKENREVICYTNDICEDDHHIQHIINLYLFDHPTCYYLQTTATKVYGFYDFVSFFVIPTTEEDISKDTIDAELDKIISNANSDDIYENIKIVHDYICENYQYDLDSYDKGSIKPMITDHVGVCKGYAQLFQAAIQKLGYKCAYINGFAYEDRGHAWNAIEIESEWYYVDCTFDDGDHYDHDYFMINVNDEFPFHTLNSDYYPYFLNIKTDN